MTCYLCKSDKIKYIIKNLKLSKYDKEFSVVKCENCGVSFLYPQVLFKDIENEYYDKNYHAYQLLNNEKNFLKRFKDFIKKNALEQYLGYGNKKFWKKIIYPFFIRISFYPKKVANGKFLSIGCGAGKQLVYNKELGWDVYGVDVSKITIQVAQSRGLDNVFNGSLKDAKFESGFFDVVDFHHVFEHISDPNNILKEVRRVLKKDGELIITVPNYSSLARKIFGKYWGGWDIPRHIFFFDDDSLSNLLKNNGFQVEESWFSDIFRGFSAGLSYLIFKKNARKYEKYFLPFGIFLDLFFDPLFQIFGWGDQLTIKAKKI